MKRMSLKWLWLLPLLAIAGLLFWWAQQIETVYRAETEASEAAQANPMLGVVRWLEAQRMAVEVADNLELALSQPLKVDVLLLADNGGLISPEQGKKVLDFVQRGGLLISTAAEYDEEDPDPLSLAFDSWLEEAHLRGDAITQIQSVRGRYNLRFEVNDDYRIVAGGSAPASIREDVSGHYLRAYRHGAGTVVFLSKNPFFNYNLPRLDHAELLLQLLALHPNAKRVQIVQGLSMPAWYEALWHKAPWGIVSLLVLLLIWLWQALLRFGPLLPEPESERRALLEHIDASGRWLWRLPGGKELLLRAARQAALARIVRRAPELARLDAQARVHRLARRHQMDEALINQAFNLPAGKTALEFTRQIHTLQTLRHLHD